MDWNSKISKGLLPDDAFLVLLERRYFIEIKYQQVPVSVDEKLQTCDFIIKQYLKLVSPLGLS